VESFVNLDTTALSIGAGAGGLSILGSSDNLDFDFWSVFFGAPDFDPFATGEYEIKLSVRDLTGVLLGEVSNTVVLRGHWLGLGCLVGLGRIVGFGGEMDAIG